MTAPVRTPDIEELIALRVRQTRTAAGMTLADLARRIVSDDLFNISITADQLSKLENRRRGLSVTELAALAQALNVDPAELMRPGVVCGSCGQEMPRS